jgi:hypothetical protein
MHLQHVMLPNSNAEVWLAIQRYQISFWIFRTECNLQELLTVVVCLWVIASYDSLFFLLY